MKATIVQLSNGIKKVLLHESNAELYGKVSKLKELEASVDEREINLDILDI